MPIKLSDLKLIGIHGHPAVGKDTVSNYIWKTYQKVSGESFANALKNACSEAFGIDRDDFDDQDTKNVIDPYWGVSPRMIAQFVGTEMFREILWKLIPGASNDFWIRRLEGKLTCSLELYEGLYEPGECVIISDVRFQNEYDWVVNNNGIIIHITRPGHTGAVGIPNHASESVLNFHNQEATYHVDNNGTLEHLFAQVDTIIGDSLVRKPDTFIL